MERRLTTILAADVVGYSRLMGKDETTTLRRLKSLRKELVQPKISERKGRVVKLMGDGLLAEFPSVVEAVQCAIDIQQSMQARETELPDEERFRLRIGLNLGDIIVEGSDIYGDGVNVAARLEALADPGGICISRTVFDHVKGKTDLEFQDLGMQAFKNIPEPIPTYKINLPTAPSPESHQTRERDQKSRVPLGDNLSEIEGIEIDLSLPDNPSIAVLPFTNMSGDTDQEFFSDGITEDIITALSKINSLLVVARNSTFTYKGQAVDVKQVSREQGVRYVLEGSVRKAGNRVRVTAQLIDATTGHHAWAERYDRDLEDIFAVQDEITREVVVALDVRLREGEQARVWSGGTKNVKAWECVRLGQEALNRVRLEDRIEARRLFEQALELDKNYPMAWFSLAGFYFHEAEYGTYSTESERDAVLGSSMDCASKAIELDPSCADAYALLGLCHLSKRDYDEAIAASEKAIALAPNQAESLALAAATFNKSGEPARSFDLIRKAMRLCPLYPSWYLSILAMACRLLRRNETAVAVYKEAIKRNPENSIEQIGLAVSLAELDRGEDAKRTVAAILRLDPKFSIKKYVERLSYRDPAELDRFEKGLRKAGLPE